MIKRKYRYNFNCYTVTQVNRSTCGDNLHASSQVTFKNLYVNCACTCLLVNVRASLVAQMIKNLSAVWETWVRSLGQGLIPGSRRFPWEGNGNPLQFSCLENPMNRGAWRAVVHGISKKQTWLSKHACTHRKCALGIY